METFEHLRRARLVLLTSRGADGVALHRAVRLAVGNDGSATLRTRAAGALAQRLSANPQVRVAPCDLRGRPSGSDQPAIAQRQSGSSTHITFRLCPAAEPTSWLIPAHD
jgi:uncharacterized protein